MADETPTQQNTFDAQENESGDAHLSWTRRPAQRATVKELTTQLRECLEDIRKLVEPPYRHASSLDHWPSVHALNQLMTLVQHLGRAIGIKKVELGYMDAVINHIDRRYPKLGLLAFIEALVRKLEAVPVGPVTRIERELAPCNDPKRKRQLLAIRDLVKSPEWEVMVKPGTWLERISRLW